MISKQVYNFVVLQAYKLHIPFTFRTFSKH